MHFPLDSRLRGNDKGRGLNMLTKSLSLFSGGLDSIIAVKLLQKQNIDVTGICFYSPFYGCEKALESAKELGIELKTIDISAEMLAVVKNPACGYGKNLNPCIDCHALMIRLANEIAQKENFDFCENGEVLGQRPFSQNKEALQRVQKLAGAEVLRPLSAKLLDETAVEKSGLVNRGLLERINGRDRHDQMELAERFQIKKYPSPAGGCLLTDPAYGERLGLMLENWPDCDSNDVNILRHGRVFWINLAKNDKQKPEKILVIIGREEADNNNLKKLAKKGDFMVQLKELNGPVTLIRSKFGLEPLDAGEITIDIPEKLNLGNRKLGEDKSADEIFQISAMLTGLYSVKARGKSAVFVLINM